ncbi:MAG: hypothetical protein ACJ8BW_13775 [Ktedonobacteraceae bacterium]|jgi:hypothetical protein
MRNYADWARETPAEETRDGQDASYEQWLGKHMAKAAIAEYNSTWASHHGHELLTRRSARKYASELAEAQTERSA